MALLASGGSTNHTLHLVAIARAAGHRAHLGRPLRPVGRRAAAARIYPNGEADVNHFHAAGGIAFLVHTLLRAGLLHDDVQTVVGRACGATRDRAARLTRRRADLGGGPKASLDESVLRPADDPFAPDGGLRMLTGRSVAR